MIIRWRERIGAKELSGVGSDSRMRILSSDCGWNVEGSWRFCGTD